MRKFIKMWLLLRILGYQEQVIFEEQKDSVDEYKRGGVLYASQKIFVLECSEFNLLIALLPRYFKKRMRPKKTGETINANKKNIRELDSLINLAKEKDYIQFPPEDAVAWEIESKSPREKDNPIRLSPKGNSFITFSGGLEELIKTFPQLWALLAISLIPWIVTNKNWIVSLFK